MEAALRLGIFVSVFVAVAALEILLPRRPKTADWRRRWGINLGILVIDVVAQRLTVGAAAFATAIYAQNHGWGLFNLLDWPFWIEALLGFLILDFAIYLQHVLSHALPAFWRLHQVHHADLDVDLTTGVRFHPLEIIISMLYKAAIVAALGIDPWVVIIFEAVLNGFSVFTHGNIHLPEWLDRRLRYVFCTPDMHRVHHSVIPCETDSNFGFCLSVWDRFCGTMLREPAKGQIGVTLGLSQFRRPDDVSLWKILLMPFRVLARQRAAQDSSETL
ncbi:MAG: sterol desaturase family protein [Proteobacteria bacterium]|nr:sterol desaturase family protein [Pseudomonadota bacterium]